MAKSNRRKVLIISYLWPPAEGVGVLRALKFAKYLPEYGWEPVILTAKAEPENASSGTGSLPDCRVHRAEDREIIESIRKYFPGRKKSDSAASGAAEARIPRRRKPSLIRELITMPDDEIGWYRSAREAGGKIFKEEPVDLIFSTSPPETAHLIAKSLKRQYKVPWVADLRDLWADDHFRPRSLFKRMALRFMERRVLKEADVVVTVSRPWAERLRASLGDVDVAVIENAYDDEDLAAVSGIRNKKLTIAYTGKLHRSYQPLGIFFKALRELIMEGRVGRDSIDVRFHVFGYDKPDISKMAASYGLRDIVGEFGRVSYSKSLEIQRSSDALLFLQWEGRSGDGWYSAKIYDYIGARRPILAIARKGGIIEELVEKTSSGIIADNERDLKEAIAGMCNEYARNGCLKYGGNEDAIAKQTRRARAAQLACLFESVIDHASREGLSV